jgi:hypothetical protein
MFAMSSTLGVEKSKKSDRERRGEKRRGEERNY